MGLVHELNMMSWYGFDMEYEWGLVIKVGIKLIRVTSITWLVGYDFI